MKKNILTIIIAASTVLNLVLTMVLVFSVVPAMNKTNNLVDKVATAVDLELEETGQSKGYEVTDLEPYDITFDNKQTINLKREQGDTEAHFVILEGVTVSFNTKADDYDDISASVKGSGVYISDIVKEVISQETIQSLDETKIKEKALEKVKEFYKSECIVRLSLKGYMFQ
ncbi:MAG: hypothetical protein K6G63_04745 [Eubacterium sp.]|nr:hypothetical protein [Eubacterium sp.]